MTDQEKRTLTEWLGECTGIEWVSQEHTIGWCPKCCHTHTRLDFTDPRVAWRLLSKLIGQERVRIISVEPTMHSLSIMKDDEWVSLWHDISLEETVCRAALSYLEEKT